MGIRPQKALDFQLCENIATIKVKNERVDTTSNKTFAKVLKQQHLIGNWSRALDQNKVQQLNRGRTIANSEDTALALIGTKF